MILSNNNYEIEIIKDSQYTLFSSDNKFYNHVYQMEEYTRNDYVSAYSVSVRSLITDYKMVIIGRAYGSIENCAVLEGGSLVILIDNYMVFFNLNTQILELKKKVIDFGTGIEIYAFDNGYIVNGEPSLIIQRDRLLLTDFEGFEYYLDRWGNAILNNMK